MGIKIIGQTHRSYAYPPDQAARELKIEMNRYSIDRMSSACSALDWAAWFFRFVLGEIEIAEVLEKERKTFVNCEDNPLKIADVKSALLYAVIKFGEAGYPGCAIILDNHTVKQFGELDELRITNAEEKQAMQVEQTKRLIESVEESVWAEQKKPLIVVN